MSVGSTLIAFALALVVGAYVARPFRKPRDIDHAIEAWVAQVRAEQEGKGEEP
jgi:hypothetical protein